METSVIEHLQGRKTVARPYQCFQLIKNSWVVQFFASYDALALHIRNLCLLKKQHFWYEYYSSKTPIERNLLRAESPKGRLLHLEVLLARGQLLALQPYEKNSTPHVWRQGPVPAVRCRRGGRGNSRKSFSFTNEKRQAQPVKEEGEVLPRGARRLKSLPEPWNQYCRIVQRSWKVQHRGRKAWDRTRHGGLHD